jgi:hypothetical protein
MKTPNSVIRVQNVYLSGKMIGRKESDCVQIGVRRMPGTSGCTIEPPAARE